MTTTTYGKMTSITQMICEISSGGGVRTRHNDTALRTRIMLAFIIQMAIYNQLLALAIDSGTEVVPKTGEENKRNSYYDLIIKAMDLGNYSLSVEAHETPYYETLPIVGEDYFPKTIAKYLVEVDNTRPSARYDMQTIRKVDIWYNNSHYDKSELFRQKLDVMVAQLRSEHNLDIQLNQIDTYDEKITKEKYKVKYIETVGSGDLGATGSQSDVAQKYLSGGITGMTVKVTSMRADGLDAVRVGVSMFISVQLDEDGRYVPTHPENLNDYTGYTGWELKVYGLGDGLIGTYKSDSMKGSSSAVSIEFQQKGEDELMAVTIGGRTYENIKIQDINVTVSNLRDGPTPAGQLGAGLTATVGTWVEEEREREVVTKIPTLLSKALTQMSWRDESIGFVIYANHDEAKAYGGNLGENVEFNKEIQYLAQTGAYYIGVCSTKNSYAFYKAYNIFKNINPYDKACAIYTNADDSMDNSIKVIKEYILSKIPNTKQSKNWILLDSSIVWNVTYDDYEGDVPLNVLAHNSDTKFISEHGVNITSRYTDDAILAEKWRFRHNQNIYDNGMGLIPTNDLWVTSPIVTFNKVGLYRINYKRKDNPFYPDVNKTNDFDNYRYWSSDYDSVVDKAS